MVNPNDVGELSGAIASLLNDREQRQNYRRAGIERAKLFSWERAARETQAVYDEVFQEWVRKKKK